MDLEEGYLQQEMVWSKCLLMLLGVMLYRAPYYVGPVARILVEWNEGAPDGLSMYRSNTNLMRVGTMLMEATHGTIDSQPYIDMAKYLYLFWLRYIMPVQQRNIVEYKHLIPRKDLEDWYKGFVEMLAKVDKPYGFMGGPPEVGKPSEVTP